MSRGDGRAVQRALRTGRAPDGRIDALAREAAARHLRNGWIIGLFAILLAVNTGIAVLRVLDGDGRWLVALSFLTAACWAGALVWYLVLRRRSRRYLAGP